MKPVGVAFAEINLDSTPMERGLKKANDALTEGTIKVENAYKSLGLKSDQVFNMMKANAVAAANFIKNKTLSSTEEIIRAQSAAATRISAINQQMMSNDYWKTLGVRSTAAINDQINLVKTSAVAQQSIFTKGSQDWINIERAKNAKLKELNREMVGEHEASMASMTRAVLRFYAAYYVISQVSSVVGNLFISGVKAIDSLKINTIAVASTLTSIQGTSGNILENYKNNLVYADALNKKLMLIDAISFANYQQLQLMNRAMNVQGVILDINNKKQVEAFTAVSNTIALMTVGQNKEKQASQEMRALMSGQIKATDQVSMMIDGIIKQEGKYRGGLKELVKLGKEHGDTLERLAPYLAGVAVASGDIGSTWEAVSSSMETAWGILQRALFKDIYKDMTNSGRTFVEWLKTNADDIVKKINQAYDAFSFAVKATTPILVAFAITTWASVGSASKAVTWFALQWDLMTTKFTLATSKMRLGFGIFTAALIGFEIGNILNKFEIIRKFGVNMVYALIDGWELVKNKAQIALEYMSANAKAKFDPENRETIIKESDERIATLKKQHEKEQTLRDEWHTQQLKDVTDVAIAEAKAKADAAKIITTPAVPTNLGTTTKDSVKDSQEALKNQIKKDKDIYDQAVKSAEQLATLSRKRGEDEYDVINTLYENKRFLLNQYLETEYKNAAAEVALEAKAATLTKDGVAKKFDFMKVLQSKYDEIYARYSKDWQKTLGEEAIATEEAKEKTISTMAALYSVIAQYSQDSIDYQINLLEKKYIQEGRYAQGSLALAVALKAEENKLYENADNFWADYYSKIDGYADVSYQKRLSYIERIRQAEIKAANATKQSETEKNIQIGAANKKASEAVITAIEDKFDQENKYTNQVITNTGKMLDAAMTMYDKDSYEYNRLAEWKKGVQVAELAMEAAKQVQIIAGYFATRMAASSAAVANAGAAVTGASIGVGPTGFATAAAMIALMASVFAMYGIVGGGSVSASAPSVALPASTVLGAEAGTGSESITKSWELMQDTYDMEYHELRGIYNEMRNLNDNITGLVTSIIRTGGVGGDMGLTLGDLGGSIAENSIVQKIGGLWGGNIANLMGDNFLAKMTNAFKYFDPLAGSISLLPKLLGSIFGGGQTATLAASGLSLSGASNRLLQSGGSVGGQQYGTVVVHEDGGWFSSDKDWSYNVYRALDIQTSSLFDKVFQNMGATLIELAKGLGTDVNAALNYVFSGATINLQGKTTEEITTALNEYFSAMGDTAVSALFGSIISQYQEVGEGMMETASRLIVDKAVILDTLKMTNQAYLGTTTNAIALSESLIALAGDLETLRDNAETYYDKFFSESEKQVRLQGQLVEAMTSMNLVLPVTRAGYRAIVEGLDLTTSAGQSAYVSLLAMAESADTYYTTLEDAADEAANATSDLVDELKSLSTTIAEWLASLGISELNPVLSEQTYKNQYATLLAAAQGPSATSDAINDYLNYATTFLTYEKSYGTGSSYQAIYDAVVADVMAIQATNNTALASYASGTDYVPETGLYRLHQGEIVSTKSDSIKTLGTAIGEYILNSNGGSTGGDIHVSVQIDGKEIGNVVARQAKTNGDLKKSIKGLMN
jgi:hypothetical protein